MLTGRFFLEIEPHQFLVGDGPWGESHAEFEWDITILPFKPLGAFSPRFLTPGSLKLLKYEELFRPELKKTPPLLQWKMTNREDFQRAFKDLKVLIERKSLQKGVPWSFAMAHLPGAQGHWNEFLSHAPHATKGQVLYGAQFENESVMGASPEWLFKIEAGGKILHTMALAGTRWPTQQRALQTEEKDIHEHELVAKDIAARLGNFGTVTVGERSWVKAGRIEHLRTSLRLESSSPIDATQMLKVLHPTPALGVSPRNSEGEKWLFSLPGSEKRADFGAPWVVRHRDGRAWALVGLRQIRLAQDHVWIPAGCGVVELSNEEAEWTEIQQKILSVRQMWGLA